jgi:uncharacterized membrane protein
MIESSIESFAQAAALAIEAIAVLVVTWGAAEAAVGLLVRVAGRRATHGQRKEVWRRFGVWLLLGLEFELAADIVVTVISPEWTDIGELAAIAVIRTFLNYFLEKDLEHATTQE